CRSSDPRDRRTRVAAVVESDAGERILIDTPPELRLQLAAAGVASVAAVLYTHDHADHIHGIDDLRAFTSRHGPLPIYGPADTLQPLTSRIQYIFYDRRRPVVTSRPGLSRRVSKRRSPGCPSCPSSLNTGSREFTDIVLVRWPTLP